MVVVDRATKGGSRFYLLLGVCLCFPEIAKHRAMQCTARRLLKAGVMDGILASDHTLTPGPPPHTLVEKRQVSWIAHLKSLPIDKIIE
jgi:hypothetical protein